ncbi:MAG: cyclic nucleotide-binding domain-containing protein [Bacteroidia bacterium]|nr:cyclic nucleotide-binding domain-containing protein [Bacteroidia bacterium]
MIYKVIEEAIGKFPDVYKKMLEEISTIRIIEKDKIILEQGKNCQHLWFINKGAVKAFEWIDGNERVAHFFFTNMFFTNYYCWVTKNTSDLTYKAVEDCEVIEIDYLIHQNLFQ